MSRIELGGYGPPIPLPEDGLEAGEGGDINRPPLSYNLPDGTIFRAADYMAFDYTNYEVVCIGASGGAGATAKANEQYGYAPGLGYGGAGGGGGLHVVSGLLVELPEEVLVDVGTVGLDGTYDADTTSPHVVVRAQNRTVKFDPPTSSQPSIGYRPPYSNNGVPIAPYFSPDFASGEVATGPVYLPNYYLGADIDGKDGGASKFGDIAMASGGKGGVRGTPFFFGSGDPGGKGGAGGDGGVGNSDVAGGGGDGANTSDAVGGATAGRDGSWDGTIGQGGGGGSGGALIQLPAPGGPVSSYGAYVLDVIYIANDSGRGSFNQQDTSRYGPKRTRQSNNEGYQVIPGAGGGATTQRRAPGTTFGGGAVTDPYPLLLGVSQTNNPNGVVVIRLIRVD